jgi:Tol biopolymer transport system component/predicted Ser/Thr protein kinase
MALTLGSHIGPYEILGSLGAGGMGEVYRARDERLRRVVAIKVLPADAGIDPDRRQRFVQEAQAASALNHPNIVHIYGIESDAGQDCIAMEYVDGRTLDDVVRSKRLTIRDALDYAVQIADALASAHAAGIVHRDIKPGNIMVTAKGLIKVLDFGLAKLTHSDFQDSTRTMAPQTRAGVVVGTAPYMSPEQAQGQPVDARSDIFSFGSVLYELLTGRRAFAGNSDVAALSAVLNTDPRPASESVRGVPPALDHLLAQCLRKDPRRRIQRLADVQIELEQIRDDLEVGAPPRLPRTAPLVATGAAGLAVALVVGTLLWMRPRDAARTEIAPVTRLTFDSGLTIDPALSPDGSLLAYASDRAGEGNLDIWIQQVPGGEPVRLTQHAADERTPAFSADGTRIAFRSERGGGGLYVMPALGGDPTLLAAGGFEPRFSPDGKWIAYHTGLKSTDDGAGRLMFASAKVFIVPAAGGQARQIQPTAKTAIAAAWSPDSTRLLIDASFELGGGVTEWWVAPLEGAAIKINLDTLIQRGLRARPAIGWMPGNRIVFPAISGDTRNHWIVTVSSRDWQIDGAPERLTAGAGIEGPASVSMAAGTPRLAFSNVVQNIDLWSVPLSQDGTQAGPAPLRLTQDAERDGFPALTPDGRTLIFVSNRRNQQQLWVRDLLTGREALLIPALPTNNILATPVVNQDGSRLAYWRQEGGGLPSATLVVDLGRAPDGSLRAGPPRELPSVADEGSGWAWSWSPAGDRLWYDPARWPRLAPNHLYDVVRGERVVEFGHPEYDLGQVKVSPDGRWVSFHEPHDDGNDRLLITRVDAAGRPSPPQEWIAVATGQGDLGWHAWSTAGDVLYYQSNRDGAICVWAQRLERDTMKPAGPPLAIYHAHSARLSIGNVGRTGRGFAVARDRIVFNMSETISNIWMTEFRTR